MKTLAELKRDLQLGTKIKMIKREVNGIEERAFTEAEIRLLTNINGYNLETLNDALFARYGYRDLEQMMRY